jgi:hypothetical protein
MAEFGPIILGRNLFATKGLRKQRKKPARPMPKFQFSPPIVVEGHGSLAISAYYALYGQNN